jgi:putative SOS response-associated peptidase YedK
MCGRYAITSAPEAIRALFRYEEQPNFPPRYNIAPTQPVPIVRMVDGKRRFALLRWGLIPSWVQDPRNFSLVINARGESVADKPAFRSAMRYRRCLFPADGFYEWKREGEVKRPYYVSLKSGEPMALAGLWETWRGPNGEEMETAAIVTTSASRSLAAIHERMPVIVPPEAFDFWLDNERVDAETAAALIAPAADRLLECHEVSPAVNRVANDSPDLIVPFTPAPETIAAEPSPARGRKSKRAAETRQASLFDES